MKWYPHLPRGASDQSQPAKPFIGTGERPAKREPRPLQVGHRIRRYRSTGVASYVEWADGKIAELKGVPPVPGDPNTPYFADDTDLSTMSQAMLDA